MLSVVASQAGQVVLTVFGTIIGGVVVYVLGRFVEGSILQPLAEQRRIFADVATALTMYANIYTNFALTNREKPDYVDQARWDKNIEDGTERDAQASRALREISSRLQGHNLSIPWYSFTTWLRLAPSRKRVLRAGSALIGISNATPARDHDDIQQNMKWRQQALQDLGLIKLRTESPNS